jgi:hypothetical protein
MAAPAALMGAIPACARVAYRAPRHQSIVAARARQIAEERYSEQVSRRRHVEYFTSLRPGGRPIAEHANANKDRARPRK